MTRLFRSKSCTLSIMPPRRPPSSSYQEEHVDVDVDVDLRDHADDDDVVVDSVLVVNKVCPAATTTTTPFIRIRKNKKAHHHHHHHHRHEAAAGQLSVLAVVAAAFRRSLVTCSVEADDVSSDVDIGWPTEVRHVSHVTFDRFHGFLGLPLELQPDLQLPKPPSASASVFGVSPQSMQCAYDARGNSVPTILLRMQNRLYSEGGLQAEGIFRINAENSQEEDVRNQLNKGVVPHGIDVHCLSGLIKAWFRELPSGILDTLSPEQVVRCNSEDECSQLVKLLPPMEAALLDWAINLMADVVQHEDHNKMNARNIAMVFAPNMTQMADPLTALIHAVQVMNFLKTLILKTLRQRQGSMLLLGDQTNLAPPLLENATFHEVLKEQQASDDTSCYYSCKKGVASNSLLRSTTLDRLECKNEEVSCGIVRSSMSDVGQGYDECMSGGRTSPVLRRRRTLAHSFKVDEYDDDNTTGAEGILNRLSLRKGMWKLRRHPVFQLSKTVKKSGGTGM